MSRILEERVKLIQALSEAAIDVPAIHTSASASESMRTIITFIEKDKAGHLLSTSKDCDGAVSYDPKGTKSETRRTRTTIGRYIRKNIIADPCFLSDTALERLTMFVHGKMFSGEEDRIKIVTGQAVLDAYEGECGTHSCMTGGGGLSKLIQFYSENPQTVGLVLCRSDECQNGYSRALFWTTNEGMKVVDRIYPNTGPHVQMIYDWASKNGHVYRVGNSLPGSSPVRLCNRGIYTVTMKPASSGMTPYLDTFCWGDFNKETNLWTLSNETKDYEWDLRTGGGRPNQVKPCFARCQACNGKIMSRDHVATYAGRQLCRNCADELSFPCELCQTRFDRQLPDPRIRIRMDRLGADRTKKWCTACVERHSQKCSGCGSLFSDGAGLRKVGRAGDLACDKCAEVCQSCGDYALKKSLVNGLCNPCAVAADADRAWATRRW